MEKYTVGIDKIKCPQCDGRGFYSVDYHLCEEETHARCEDCNGKGKLDVEKKKEI